MHPIPEGAAADPSSANPNFQESATQRAEDHVRSTFYEWSCKYFSESFMQPPEDEEELVGAETCERKWQMLKNREIVKHARKLTSSKDAKLNITSFDNEIAILENSTPLVTQLCFHPFEQLVLVSTELGVSTWNWDTLHKQNTFTNSPEGTRINSLTFLNEQSSTHSFMVGTGSEDGVVSIWEGVNDPGKTKLVTAWRVLGDLIPSSVRYLPGVVLEWLKSRQYLVASGNVDVIKIWDITKELAVQDIPTENPLVPVTALASNEDTTNNNAFLILAGAADGAIRLFDRRMSNKHAMIGQATEHKGWIINLCLPSTLNQQFLSGASSGEVKIWDLRQTKSSVKTILAHPTPNMSAFAVHNYVPLFAVGSQDHKIRVMRFDGSEVSVIRYHDGFLGQRLGPVSTLQFHPYKVILGAGASDCIASVYEAQ